MSHAIVHRALVTYSNERTGEIRVRIPVALGNDSEIALSTLGRAPFNDLWVVPSIGSQIAVSSDDHNLTNVFWVQNYGYDATKHYRNYFEAYDTTNQIATVSGGVGVSTNITYNTVVFSEGIRLVNNSKITFDYEGTYNLQYSIQWQNTDSQAHDTVVWIAYNDTEYPNSATYASIPSKHGSVNGTTVTAINFVGRAYRGDYIELHWAGNSTALSMHTITAGTITTLPSIAPTAPSIIVTVTQVA